MSLPTIEQRLAQRQRPPGQPLMHNRWEELLFLHWDWNAADLQRRIPPGLQVDTHAGRAYLGLVPFLMRDVRFQHSALRGLAFNFHELNLRTYVYDDAGRPGVWFFALDCDFLPAVLTARALFKLPYYFKFIRSRRSGSGYFKYSCDGGNSADYRYRAASAPAEAQPGSLDFFLLERYLLFAGQSRRLSCARVHHAPYQISRAEVRHYGAAPLAWHGFDVPGRPPDHAHYVASVDVEIFGPQTAGT